jgi:IS5 family transposase
MLKNASIKLQGSAQNLAKAGEIMKNSEPTPTHTPLPLAPQLNPQHPLLQLAQAIDWSYFEGEFSNLSTSEVGRPPLPARLLVGLHYLKALYNESDESVVAKWLENPYWQFFCGEQYFQQDLPCHPTTLVKWRQRIGADGMEKLLKQILQTAQQQQALKPSDIKRVIVDTTVQEKAIAFPTDARLYDKARRALVREARQQQIKLRQSYVRLGKRALFKQSRYAAAQQGRRAQKETRRLRTYLGRVIRDIERKLAKPVKAMKELLTAAKRIYQQQQQDSQKLYSLHAPEVECIAKGKAHKKYEFGCKVAVVTTNESNWIVGIEAKHGNPYDGATLKPSLLQVEKLTGVKPKEAYVDQGFRGSDHHPEGVEVYISGKRKLSGKLKQLLKRRSAIEPVIGHSKNDHGLGRNYLRGETGDRVNALLSGCGFNLRKLWRFFAAMPPIKAEALA